MRDGFHQAGRPYIVRRLLQEELHSMATGPGFGMLGPGLEEGVQGGGIQRVVAELVGLAGAVRFRSAQAHAFALGGHEGEGLDPLPLHELVEMEEPPVVAAGAVEDPVFPPPLGRPLGEDEGEASAVGGMLQAALGVGQEVVEQVQGRVSGLLHPTASKGPRHPSRTRHSP